MRGYRRPTPGQVWKHRRKKGLVVLITAITDGKLTLQKRTPPRIYFRYGGTTQGKLSWMNKSDFVVTFYYSHWRQRALDESR